MRICERSSCADSRVKEEGEARGAPGARDEISLQPMVQPVVKPLLPCSSGRLMGSREPPAAHGYPHTGTVGCPKEVVDPGEAYANSFYGGTCDPVGF